MNVIPHSMTAREQAWRGVPQVESNICTLKDHWETKVPIFKMIPYLLAARYLVMIILKFRLFIGETRMKPTSFL